MSNIPLTVLVEVNKAEKLKLTGEYKKYNVMSEVRTLLEDNIDTEQLIADLIELLIDLSRKNLKLAINKTKRLCIG